MTRRGPFLIEHTAGNTSGSIPAHWDIFIEDSDDSIVTVWDSLALAEYIAFSLRGYGKWAALAMNRPDVDKSRGTCG